MCRCVNIIFGKHGQTKRLHPPWGVRAFIEKRTAKRKEGSRMTRFEELEEKAREAPQSMTDAEEKELRKLYDAKKNEEMAQRRKKRTAKWAEAEYRK
jgi:hypothetical protein